MKTFFFLFLGGGGIKVTRLAYFCLFANGSYWKIAEVGSSHFWVTFYPVEFYTLLWTKMGLATFRAVFSHTHLVTLSELEAVFQYF
jgi:hypothetical protein